VAVNAPEHVIKRDVLVEAEIIEQPRPAFPESPSSPPLPNHMRQRITALPSHQSTADFFNDICALLPFLPTVGYGNPPIATFATQVIDSPPNGRPTISFPNCA
jgi:hypothetical protein